MSETPKVRPADRHEWDRTIRRVRFTGVIAGNAAGSRGGVSGAAFKAVAYTWATHANPDGSNIYPGDATLAVEAEVGLKAVKAIKAAMVRLGLTERTKAGARRWGQNDVYRLTLPVDPPLGEVVEMLSPDEVRAAAVETYEKQRGRQRGSDGPLTDHTGYVVVESPPDPQQTAVQGPADPRQEDAPAVRRGSDGPTNDRYRGSNGPVVGGPEDRDTNPLPSPKRTTNPSTPEPSSGEPATEAPQSTNGAVVVGYLVPGASRKARRNGAKVTKPPTQPTPRPVTLFPKTAAKPPEAVQIIWDDLRRRGNPHVTQDDARAVLDALRAQYGDKVKPPYLRGIAGNTGFVDHFAAIKAARATKIEAEITRLREIEPECEHGTAAGKTPHPTTRLPLCPQCRAGHAPTVDDAPTTPAPVIATLDAYRATYRGQLTAEQLVTLTQQATGLHRRGADTDALTALARRAGEAGVQLLTAATQGGAP